MQRIDFGSGSHFQMAIVINFVVKWSAKRGGCSEAANPDEARRSATSAVAKAPRHYTLCSKEYLRLVVAQKTLSIRVVKALSNMYLSFHHVFIFVDRVCTCGYECESAGTRNRYLRINLQLMIQRISLTWFPAQMIGSSNTGATDSLYLLVLITGTSQSRQHRSHKSPTTVLFDVDTGRISIRHSEMLKSTTLNVLARSLG
ncbi:hypothetical protein Tco_0328133 [Tanacetum coccineum]